MQSILRWSLENSTPMDERPGDQPPTERKPIDPAIIDMILGRPDAELMKEDMDKALDESLDEDERLSALDHLEMLVEQIDNANDLVKINLWEPLEKLAMSESSPQSIRTQALWVIGTAVQNNPSAQDVYLGYRPLPALLSFLDPSKAFDASARAKAVYALSGLLKHNNAGVKALEDPEVDGWTKLRESIRDPSISVRRKIVFLLSALLTPASPSSPSPSKPRTLPSSQPQPNVPLLQDQPSTRGTLHASDPYYSLSQSNGPALHGAGVDPKSEPIHANSHASHLRNPAGASTWRETAAAFEKYQILDTIISGLTNPLPYGEDGEFTEPDTEFQERAVSAIYTYAVQCHASLTKEQKERIRNWIQSEKKATTGGEAELLERWGLSRPDYAALIGKLL